MPTYDGIGTSSITHRVEVVGDSIFQDVDGGTLSTKVPVQIFSNYENSPGSVDSSRQLRFRVQSVNETDVSNSYVTDMGIKGADGSNYFFITAPQNTSTVGDQNTFVISTTSNVGIGTTDPVATLQVVGDIKCQTLTATTITGGSPLTISATSISIQAPVAMPADVPMSIGTMTVSNIFHSDQLTMSANVFVTEGSVLTLSNIFHSDELTMSANIAMGSDKTLTTSNIETYNLTVSNRLSGGTISVSNIEATANLVVGGPVDITGTLSSAGITSSADVNVTGTITTSNIVAHVNENLLISSNLEVGTSNLFVNTANGNVGIGTNAPLSTARLDVRGDGMVFDKAEGDGTILIGLYNWVDTQSFIIDMGVYGSPTPAGTVTASTDYDPPPGTAGDVICKFQNTSGGEAITYPFYPGLTGSTNDVFTFGVWALATQDVAMEFFINPGGTGTRASSFTVVGDGTWRFYQVSVTLAAAATNINMYFRIDNNSSGRTVYLTGASIRKNPTPGVVLPFTPRYSPIDGKGTVFATQNLVAKEAAIKTLTGNVGIGVASPASKLHVDGGITFKYNNSIDATSGTGWTNNKVLSASWDGTYDITQLWVPGANSDSTPRITIRSNGNVGIGTDSPGSELQLHKLEGTDNLKSAAALKFSTNNTSGSVWDLGSIRGAINLNNGGSNYYPGGLVFATKSPTNTTTTGFTDRMVIDANGNVGIGKTNPTNKLTIKTNWATNDYDGIFIKDNNDNDYAIIAAATTDVGGANSAGYMRLYNTTGALNGILLHGAGNSYINGGNVGIGVASPNYKLDVYSTDTYTANFERNIRIKHSSATDGNIYIQQNPDSTSYVLSNSTAKNLHFGTNNQYNQIVCIPNGNVGIGISTPNYKLHVAGDIYTGSTIRSNQIEMMGSGIRKSGGESYLAFQNGGHHIDARWNNGTGRALYINYYSTGQVLVPSLDYASSSDQRIKDNIVDVSDDEALDLIRQLKPKTYTLKENPNKGRVFGFIAQDVKEVIPAAVTSNHTLAIPNILDEAVVNSNVFTLSTKTTELLKEGEIVLIQNSFIDTSRRDFVVDEVIDERTFRVKETENLQSNMIVVGTRVDDFHMLAETYISTIAVSALQEVDRQLQAEKQKTANLETQLASLLARIEALENSS